MSLLGATYPRRLHQTNPPQSSYRPGSDCQRRHWRSRKRSDDLRRMLLHVELSCWMRRRGRRGRERRGIRGKKRRIKGGGAGRERRTGDSALRAESQPGPRPARPLMARRPGSLRSVRCPPSPVSSAVLLFRLLRPSILATSPWLAVLHEDFH